MQSDSIEKPCVGHSELKGGVGNLILSRNQEFALFWVRYADLVVSCNRAGTLPDSESIFIIIRQMSKGKRLFIWHTWH